MTVEKKKAFIRQYLLLIQQIDGRLIDTTRIRERFKNVIQDTTFNQPRADKVLKTLEKFINLTNR